MAELTVDRYADAFEALCNPQLRQAMYDAGGVIMADTLLTLHGDPHRNRRHLALRVFRRNFLRFYENEVFPATLEETLAPLLARGEADLVELGYRVTMNLTADFAGVDRKHRNSEDTDALLALVRTFSEGATLVHSTREPAQVQAEVRAALDQFETRFLGPSRARRETLLERFAAGAVQEEALPRDVLTVLLRNEDRVPLSAEVLRREIAFYLQAGAHSTANATVHALHELFAWRAAFPERWRSQAQDPLFLQRCVHESLRLHPASPVAWRSPVAPVTVAGHALTPDDKLIIDLHRANRDPAVFGPDADRYNPERQLLDPKAYPFGLSFGIGVHNCLGRDLDGGVLATRDRIPDEGQLGIVARLVRRLLRAGVQRHPTKSAEAAAETERAHWGCYPVCFKDAA